MNNNIMNKKDLKLKIKKEWKNLDITNDFIFSKFMQDEEIAKITGLSLNDIKKIRDEN